MQWDRGRFHMRALRRSDVIAPSVTLALICVALVAPGAHAATFTVNTTTDATGSCPTPTTCSLRQAIAETNAAAGADVIDFDLPPAR